MVALAVGSAPGPPRPLLVTGLSHVVRAFLLQVRSTPVRLLCMFVRLRAVPCRPLRCGSRLLLVLLARRPVPPGVVRPLGSLECSSPGGLGPAPCGLRALVRRGGGFARIGHRGGWYPLPTERIRGRGCDDSPVRTPQSGIFALGTASHAYLELDAPAGRAPRDLVAVVSSLREPRTTMGGVNLVAGFRPELWRDAAPADAPPGVEGFNEALVGVDGYTMPATQHDIVLWISGSAYDVVFDVSRMAIRALAGVATIAEETSSWPYRHDLDLTGFIDGTENPSLIEAPESVLVADGAPGAGGTILLLQKWAHDATAWESLPVVEQERVIGRTKAESVELEDGPADSHVASTDQDRFGKIFRRNMPYGTVTDHGTMFVGFCAHQRPLAAMLESMAGLDDGSPDALTRYTHPLTGAYYFVPSTESLRLVGA